MNPSALMSIVRARVFSRPAPIVVGFELTHLCNLNCVYCDRHKRLPNEMSLAEILAALGGLRTLGMREISLDGGEALAHPYIEEIVTWLGERKVVMRLNTNGVLVRRKVSVVRKMQKLKISLDGPPAIHNSIRGVRAFEWALDAAGVAKALSVPVEFTCVVGRHNAHAIDELLGIVEGLGAPIIFQPVRQSLFQKQAGSASDLALSTREINVVFSGIEAFKRAGRPVLNGWSSLRHFRKFPLDQVLPCAAGWLNVTLDPEGNLYHCGQVSRSDKSNNIVKLGAKEAFARLTRFGCGQCWCARVVEENYAWGGRFDQMLPPRRHRALGSFSGLLKPQETRLDVPVSALLRKT